MARSGYDNSSTENFVTSNEAGHGGIGASQVLNAGRSKRTKRIWIWIAIAIGVLAIAGIIVGVLFAEKVIKIGSGTASTEESESAHPTVGAAVGATSTALSSSRAISSSASASQTVSSTVSVSTSSTTSSSSSTPEPTTCSTSDSIPSSFKGTYMDPTSWLDMEGFNCTFTKDTVGDLPILGLNSTWDDSTKANPTVPALNEPWGAYSARPIRGVNLGGWLSLEPFITPSLFEYPSNLNIVDEYSLCAHLGPKDSAALLEKHYSTFFTENDFKSIAAAGLDHVRIPFSYWAVTTFDNDPYVAKLSWRYLLRGIEWARKYGLRVKLDLHALPGSQNGWNHSGRQGTIGFLTGDNGGANGQRALDIHDQLSKFFAQDRYKNVVAFYGLANEPGMAIPLDDLVNWTNEAYKIVHNNGVSAVQVFSESMRGLGTWAGKLAGYGDSLVIDVHEYTIFDNNLLKLKHAERISFVCGVSTQQIGASMDKSGGFGPTMVGEWSQADTDCAKYLNGMGNGARWTGTFYGSGNTPACSAQDSSCSCEQANADASSFTPEFKLFLRTWGAAQMSAFEKSWGWFYWTWKTESAPLWSYQAGLQGDFLPALAYERTWDCTQPVPDFGSLPENY